MRLLLLLPQAVLVLLPGSRSLGFGRLTSESHALAGLTGAALAIHGDFGAVNWGEWSKVLIGLLFLNHIRFAAGWIVKAINKLLR